jgi:hypothetical protein
MAKITQAEKLARGITGLLGYKEMESESDKYRKFQNPDDTTEFFFVGKRGSFRIGKSFEKSVSFKSTKLYEKIMKEPVDKSQSV